MSKFRRSAGRSAANIVQTLRDIERIDRIFNTDRNVTVTSRRVRLWSWVLLFLSVLFIVVSIVELRHVYNIPRLLAALLFLASGVLGVSSAHLKHRRIAMAFYVLLAVSIVYSVIVTSYFDIAVPNIEISSPSCDAVCVSRGTTQIITFSILGIILPLVFYSWCVFCAKSMLLSMDDVQPQTYMRNMAKTQVVEAKPIKIAPLPDDLKMPDLPPDFPLRPHVTPSYPVNIHHGTAIPASVYMRKRRGSLPSGAAMRRKTPMFAYMPSTASTDSNASASGVNVVFGRPRSDSLPGSVEPQAPKQPSTLAPSRLVRPRGRFATVSGPVFAEIASKSHELAAESPV